MTVRGVTALVFDAIEQTSRIVESMHATIAAAPSPFASPQDRRTNGVTGIVYDGVRLVTLSVRKAVDVGLRALVDEVEPAVSRPEWDAIRSVVNGVVGDHLVASQNPLAIAMSFRRGGRTLPLDAAGLAATLPEATGKILVLAHGLCMSDRQWRRRGHDHGASLARDFGYTPVYLRYNSGRHVSQNGRELAAILDRLAVGWPVPVTEVVVVAHSMGGLVARSACAYAAPQSLWRERLRAIVFLGTPHHGAPLERGGNWLQTLVGRSPYTAPLARLGMLRSAGITDLRFGNVVDDDWADGDRFHPGGDQRRATALPDGVDCYAIAATLGKSRDDGPFGDGLVPVASALGEHPRDEQTLGLADDRRFVAYRANHWDLLDRADVYAKLVEWLNERRSS